MGKTRLEELCYELYGSWNQHDSWHRYAMIRELRELMKQPKGGSDHFERFGDDRRFGVGQFRDGADGDEEQYPVMDDETDLLGTRMIVDPNLENQEDWEQIVILEEESIPQSKVSIPQSNSEMLKGSEPEKVDLGIEKLEHVVMNEVDGDVEKDQKVMSDTKIYSAHQLFDQMPLRIASKEKRRKSLKAWKFKFKPTSKRSRLMDDKFSFGDATVLLNKDPQETIWDCVKKEFKGTMAACGMKRVDQFKLVDEKESRLEVLDLNQAFRYQQIGHGVDILPVRKMLVHNKEMDVVLQRSTSLLICDYPNRSSRANRVWKPGELDQVLVIDDVVSLGKDVKLSDCIALPLITPSSSVLQVFSHTNRSVWEPGGFHYVQVQENRVRHERNKAEGVEFSVQRIGVASEIENQTVTAVVVYDKRSDRVWEPGGLLGVPNKKFEAELEIYDCETKKHMLLLMKLANRVWDPGGSNSEDD